MATRIFLIMIAFSFLSCDSEKEKIENEQVLLLMEKAKETQSIGINSFVLEAYVWRDFMPVYPADGEGSKMMSINWLVNSDSTPIPDHINMVKQYVIYQDEIWEADYEDEQHPTDAHKMVRISRNGPKWETGISVTVVSQIYDSKTKTNYYIKCNNVTVDRTD